jgi:hypothetical protein
MAELEFPEEREAPEADAAEQSRALDGREAGPGAEDSALGEPLPAEADPADAAEQAVPVPVDEDEYR